MIMKTVGNLCWDALWFGDHGLKSSGFGALSEWIMGLSGSLSNVSVTTWLGTDSLEGNLEGINDIIILGNTVLSLYRALSQILTISIH